MIDFVQCSLTASFSKLGFRHCMLQLEQLCAVLQKPFLLLPCVAHLLQLVLQALVACTLILLLPAPQTGVNSCCTNRAVKVWTGLP